MKKQINSSLKAHLLRGAFFLLLLVAVCAIPFALAQRNARSTNQRTLAPAPQVKATTAKKGSMQLSSAGRIQSQHRVKAHPMKRVTSRNPVTSVMRKLLVNTPLFTYMIDDGTAEDSVGLTAGGALICLNSFQVTGGNSFITSISIAWGTPAFPDPSLDGLPYTAVLWGDPNDDGNPVDAVVLATADGVISDQGTDTFLISDITPTLLTTTNFFVGFIINHAAGQFPAAFDETAPLPNRSYVSATGDINNLSDALPIEVATGGALVGNWLIRAEGGVPGLAVLSTDPAVGSIVSTPPTDFTVNQ
jgi:hypothetical protein